MSGCKEVKSRSYQTRKSPAFHAKDCKGLSKKGKDGTYISQADKRGVYKWVKGATRKVKGKYYDVHDNGSNPFRVYIDGSNVSIYKATYDDTNNHFDDDPKYTKLLKELKVKEVFIGKSTGLAADADHRPDQAKQFVGNSILLHVSGKKYVYIGSEVYEFEMNDPVEAYYSMVGNNDVPYPVLLGKENVYLLMQGDHVYVPRDKFIGIKTKEEWEGAWSTYAGMRDHEGKSVKFEDRKKYSLEKYAKALKGFRMIQKRN